MELRVWIGLFSFTPGYRSGETMLTVEIDDEPETMILCTRECREITG